MNPKRHATNPHEKIAMTQDQVGVVGFIAGMMFFATLDLIFTNLVGA